MAGVAQRPEIVGVEASRVLDAVERLDVVHVRGCHQLAGGFAVGTQRMPG
jgi:hypothetical protein